MLVDLELHENTDLTQDERVFLRLVHGNLRRAHSLLSVDWEALNAADKAGNEQELQDVQETLDDVPSWFERHRVNLAFSMSAANFIRGIAELIRDFIVPS